jgi:hypothetical protein
LRSVFILFLLHLHSLLHLSSTFTDLDFLSDSYWSQTHNLRVF